MRIDQIETATLVEELSKNIPEWKIFLPTAGPRDYALLIPPLPPPEFGHAADGLVVHNKVGLWGTHDREEPIPRRLMSLPTLIEFLKTRGLEYIVSSNLRRYGLLATWYSYIDECRFNPHLKAALLGYIAGGTDLILKNLLLNRPVTSPQKRALYKVLMQRYPYSRDIRNRWLSLILAPSKKE